MHWYKVKYGEKHAYYKKMLNAFWFTANIQNGEKFITAREYEYLKLQLSIIRTGTKAWNSGKSGIYSAEYRQKISDNHADVSGKNNPRYGSRAMINFETHDRCIVSADQIEEYKLHGYVCTQDLKLFNNGKIEIKAITCPTGFKSGKLPIQHTKEELEQLHIARSERSKKRMKGQGNPAYGRKWMHHPITHDVIFVKREEIYEFEKKGYVLGNYGNTSKSFSTSNRKWMYDPISLKRICVKISDIQQYLDKGYLIGMKP